MSLEEDEKEEIQGFYCPKGLIKENPRMAYTIKEGNYKYGNLGVVVRYPASSSINGSNVTLGV